MKIKIKEKEKCKYDFLSLGEVMLRFDPGEGKIRTARSFGVFEGGGEYNVARAMKKCFGMDSAVVTAMADNEIGRLLEDLIMQGGVSTEFVKWMPYDKIGRNCRNGLNFVERGFGIRGAKGTSDRGYTAVSQLKVGDIDWDFIFGVSGVRWFHTGGIFMALSDSTGDVALEAMKKAKEYGVVTSFDFNYRASLWNCLENPKKLKKTVCEILRYTDVVFGNEFDFVNNLGLSWNPEDDIDKTDLVRYEKFMGKVMADYDNIKLIASTVRKVVSASVNDWSAVCFDGEKLKKGIAFDSMQILDRIGGGDSFASGLIFGIMQGFDCEKALNYGVAHGALAMTTPGDTSMATLSEVESIVGGKSAKVVR